MTSLLEDVMNIANPPNKDQNEEDDRSIGEKNVFKSRSKSNNNGRTDVSNIAKRRSRRNISGSKIDNDIMKSSSSTKKEIMRIRRKSDSNSKTEKDFVKSRSRSDSGNSKAGNISSITNKDEKSEIRNRTSSSNTSKSDITRSRSNSQCRKNSIAKRQRREKTHCNDPMIDNLITSAIVSVRKNEDLSKTKMENNFDAIKVSTILKGQDEPGDADNIIEDDMNGQHQSHEEKSYSSTSDSELKQNTHSDTIDAPEVKAVDNNKNVETEQNDDVGVKKLAKIGNRKKRNEYSCQSEKSIFKRKKYGPEKDRTCPFCNKVFSIVTGLAYHIEHGVCRTYQRKSNSGIRRNKYSEGVVPFHILDEGDLFITDYGIVKVLADNRAPPDYGSTPLPEGVKRTAKIYRRKMERIAASNKKMQANDALSQLQRRDLLVHLNESYRSWTREKEVLDKEEWDKKLAAAVWSVYSIGTTPRNVPVRTESVPVQQDCDGQIAEEDQPSSAKEGNDSPPLDNFSRKTVYRTDLGPNPMIPKDCYPDRIVECVIISDTRPKVTTLEIEKEGEGRISKVAVSKSITKATLERERRAAKDKAYKSTDIRNDDEKINIVTQGEPGVKLYLRRHMLTSVYNPVLPSYVCVACGSTFSSRMGFKNHIDGNICKKRSDQLFDEKRDQQKKLVEATAEAKRRNQLRNLAEAAIKAERQRLSMVVENPPSERKLPKSRKRRRKGDKHPSCAKSPTNYSSIYPGIWDFLGFKIGRPRKKKHPFAFGKTVHRRVSRAGKDLISPDGAVYPQIWSFLFNHISAAERRRDSLGIVSPDTSTPSHQPHALQESADRVNQAIVPVTATAVVKKKRRKGTPLVDLNATVDVREIVKEIRVGRYPSITPYFGNHDDTCVLCKTDKGNLFFCEYCRNSEHLECLQSKLKVQDHDPCDEFMCHDCLYAAVHRIARLNRRRKRDKEDREMLMMENGIALESDGDLNNATELSAATKAAIAIKREVVWKESDFDCQKVSYRKCPNGGPGGLICCQSCSNAYSRFLVSTTMEMECQSVSSVGKEVSELMELLLAAQVKLKQSMDLTNTNEIRRSLLDKDEVENFNSKDAKEVSHNDQAFGIMDIF